MKFIEDILCLIGVLLIGAGVGIQFGWDWSMVIVGSLLLILGVGIAIKGGMNDPK